MTTDNHKGDLTMRQSGRTFRAVKHCLDMARSGERILYLTTHTRECHYILDLILANNLHHEGFISRSAFRIEFPSKGLFQLVSLDDSKDNYCGYDAKLAVDHHVLEQNSIFFLKWKDAFSALAQEDEEKKS